MRCSAAPAFAAAVLGACVVCVLGACVQACVIGNDGKQYNLEGTERVPPKQRAHDAREGMEGCNKEVGKLQQSFRRETVGAVIALGGASAKNTKARAMVTIGAPDSDPILTLAPDPSSAKSGAAAPAPSLRGALDDVLLTQASAGDGKAARATGRTLIASDGVVQLLAAADR